jgi:hypothetical protein
MNEYRVPNVVNRLNFPAQHELTVTGSHFR